MKQRSQYYNEEIEIVKYGVWIDGHFTWLDSWSCQYKEDKIIYENNNMNLIISLQVIYREKTILQEMTFRNLNCDTRQIKVFCNPLFSKKNDKKITFFAPILQAMVHNVDGYYFLLNGRLKRRGIVQYCTNFDETDCLQNGTIFMQPFSLRSSKSIYSLEGEMDAKEEIKVYFWQCSGSSKYEIMKKNRFIQLNLPNETEFGT
ncbi:hypothetical protein BKP37_05810 [Anaerobacillus alkalilacustris]|uniref:Uncharacterized protein n=1 Tax=Anaerobacillus alkalilacustris TaxID=393763 RepID=A0A1S2LX28_9BACI|nr:hypothetical protein [Anaerobacillus alkalilacustris]OIJ16740.1 hypothetical protein BKP37_05810 [Anaerobacillus alkalilacustris]